MNRQERRQNERKRKAIAKQISLLTKSEEKELWFKQGFNEAVKACYASFAVALDARGITQDETVDILRHADEQLLFYIGSEENIQEAFDKTGLRLDFNAVLASDRIDSKEG